MYRGFKSLARIRGLIVVILVLLAAPSVSAKVFLRNSPTDRKSYEHTCGNPSGARIAYTVNVEGARQKPVYAVYLPRPQARVGRTTRNLATTGSASAGAWTYSETTIKRKPFCCFRTTEDPIEPGDAPVTFTLQATVGQTFQDRRYEYRLVGGGLRGSARWYYSVGEPDGTENPLNTRLTKGQRPRKTCRVWGALERCISSGPLADPLADVCSPSTMVCSPVPLTNVPGDCSTIDFYVLDEKDPDPSFECTDITGGVEIEASDSSGNWILNEFIFDNPCLGDSLPPTCLDVGEDVFEVVLLRQDEVAEGDTVGVVDAVVTGLHESGFWVQDDEAQSTPFSGILVWLGGPPVGLTLGEMIDAFGVYTEGSGTGRLTVDTVGCVLSSDCDTVPVPATVRVCDINGTPDNPEAEQWEGVLVRIDSVQVSADLGSGSWAVIPYAGNAGCSAQDTLIIGTSALDPHTQPEVGDSLVAVRGILELTAGEYRLNPRGDSDILLPALAGVRQDPATFDVARLAQNQPNPFSPPTRISFTLSKDAHVRLKVFSTSGELVRTLVDGAVSLGEHTAEWDGRDDQGNPVASGVYFYQFKAVGQTQTRGMVLVR